MSNIEEMKEQKNQLTKSESEKTLLQEQITTL